MESFWSPRLKKLVEFLSGAPEDRFYRITGFFALTCEMGLATWIFQRLGVAWWLPIAISLDLPFVNGP
ncbi:MAG: hypothetical protein A3J28_05200 [Acidobacteria bacterium RIFCSPLOWO2_12_FULL_60_22]|nr:MAG: hypothetical protein A3J28_05200 [Acidobacteria bacterium RIFCSPLOWO2_12_FULL_60_22]